MLDYSFKIFSFNSSGRPSNGKTCGEPGLFLSPQRKDKHLRKGTWQTKMKGLLMEERRRKRCLVLSAVVLSVVVIIIVVAVPVVLIHQAPLKSTFIQRCEKFGRNDCQNIFAKFEKAYKGRDPCKITMEAYYPVLNKFPFDHPCDKTIFWSKTKDLVLDYTKNKDCFTLNKNLLGFVLNDLTWCGKEGSNETFTTDCPGWDDCKNNPVNSFWDAASAKLAEDTCGVVTAVLDGSREKPFDPNSTFARIEMKNFKERKVQRLDVILVPVTNNVIRSNCASQNLQDLRKELDPKIDFTCKEQTQLQIDTCTSNAAMDRGPCFFFVCFFLFVGFSLSLL